MVSRRQAVHRLGFILSALGVAFITFQTVRAGNPSPEVRELLHRADHFEKLGDWDKACDAVEELLKLDRANGGYQDRYRFYLRRINQVRRLRDASYQKQVLTLPYSQALRLWEVVTFTLLETSIEKQKTEPGRLFRKGVEELKSALNEPFFRKEHLPQNRAEDLLAFRAFLTKYEAPVPLTREQSAELVREIALEGLRSLKLKPSVVVMEFACGACHAIDDYTIYLTPNQIHELTSALAGQPVGVGLKLAMRDGKLVIADVLPNSPASEVMPLLGKHDQIIALDKRPAATLTLEVATAYLEGEAGGIVELTVLDANMELRTLELRRRPVFLPSVQYEIKAGGIAHLRISAFQESTLTELDAALLAIQKGGAKGVMLDLRGNGGGIFEVAVESAKRFLSNGIIVSTQHANPRDNMVYRANAPAPCNLPLVVLVDADTASAAEVLAGALKENRRGRLVGQTTFGKGCTQGLLRLPAQGLLNPSPKDVGPTTGGLRVTVAHLYSPTGQSYAGKGVSPHVAINRRPTPESLGESDQQVQSARSELVRMLDRQ